MNKISRIDDQEIYGKMKGPRVVWKFPIPHDGSMMFRFSLPTPGYAHPIHFDLQNGIPTLWAEVRPEMEFFHAKMIVLATGIKIPDDVISHVGTWQDGSFVWHLYHCAK